MNRHRLLALVLASLATIVNAPPASAQNSTRDCTSVAISSQVVVTLRDGSTRRGLLLCMGERETRLALDGRVDGYPLVEIRRVVRPRDSVWDGFLKGAAIPLIAWLAFCPGATVGTLCRESCSVTAASAWQSTRCTAVPANSTERRPCAEAPSPALRTGRRPGSLLSA